MCAPHPAAFTTTWSTVANAAAFFFASVRAVSRWPLWAARAPQHVWSPGTTTRQPFLASTRIVARFTRRNQRSCTQPDRRATVPRSSPCGSVLRGSRPAAQAPRGINDRTRRGRKGRATGASAPATRVRVGDGRTTSRPTHRTNRARLERSGSICVRAASIIRPNGTWDGHTSSQARQTRHRSMNRANVSSVAARPSWTARIAVIRPRGDADSSPVSRYVGQCGRQRPHATQAFRSAWDGESPGAHPASQSTSGPMNRTPSGRSVPRGLVSMPPIISRQAGRRARCAPGRRGARRRDPAPSISRARRWPSKIASEIIRGATQSPIR